MFLGQVKDKVVELLADGRFGEARELALRARGAYPKQRALTEIWVAETLCRTGDEDAALAVLRDALDEGVWWWHELLMINPPLRSIQGRPEFAEIVRRSEGCRDRAPRETTPIVFEPEGKPRGVLVALHARADRHVGFARRWKPFSTAGFRVVVPQSSEVSTSDGDLGWIDDGLARGQVAELCAGVADGLPLVLAGYSQGARFAAEWSLSGVIPEATGFIALCPPEHNMPVVTDAARPSRGVVLTGEHDDDRPAAERFAAELARHGFDVKLDVMAETGHTYPKDFADRIHGALAHVCVSRT
ncbi:hypothetical protein NLX83_31700 [Allokutzneria sp. A3M-2-11 16]|uniref:alpha/beta hydrolase n=1 Tax=Allokutzneria sp. A3M-2-11 16 TaxID=2962043 RepID=UPI0020B6808B|nr:hypothetical protein [Allokutzneria sp. A3M-2-11 16]MCP3803843.1 hypothetical protein [Allokutzneria sp. A3M-2-11 16]